MKRTLKRESKELEIVWRVTVFEQCGGSPLPRFARRVVCGLHIPSSRGFCPGKSGGGRWCLAARYSPPVRACPWAGPRTLKEARTFTVSLPQDADEMLKITPS